MKIRKSIARRFRVTKTGKVIRGSSFARHLKRKKTKAQKRRTRVPQKLEGRMAIKVKKLLGR